MKVPGFCGPAYESRSMIIAGERCINWMPERMQTRYAKNDFALYPTPGLKTFGTSSAMPGRGIFGNDGRLFSVQGSRLIEWSSGGTPTDRGAVGLDTNPVTMSTNGDGGQELFITSNDKGWILDLGTNALTEEVSDVTMGDQLDGFFVALDGNSSTLKISDSLDGKTWDGSQIAQRTSASDPWIAMKVSRGEIFLFGEHTGEVWFNAGTSPFPFAQRSGALFQVGTAAPFSVAPFGNTLAWLGRSIRGEGRVYWMNGYTPNPISNHAIEWAIQKYKDDQGIADAVGWSFERNGHDIYVLTFPAQGKTWAFDSSTNQWFELGFWNNVAFEEYRPRFQVHMFGKNLVCDRGSAIVYELSDTTYTDAGGVALRRVRRTPHMAGENRRIYFDYFELEAERGVGLDGAVTTQGNDPLVMLRYSNDGGKTFSQERTRSLGKIGETKARIRWDMCGSGRDRVWEVSCSEPVSVVLVDAYTGIS